MPYPGLPADSHVHSQWSWDALAGSMEATCERAVRLGLPALAFTEHADFTPWVLGPGERLPDAWLPLVREGVLTPPELDLDGYRACLTRCRERFPRLTILSGVELSEPHHHAGRSSRLLRSGRFERVLASVHSLPVGGGFTEVSALYGERPASAVVRDYLAETLRLIEGFDDFEVLAHLDYPARSWPGQAFAAAAFEEEFREVLRALARAGKALEVNTRVPLGPEVLRWWREEGGRAVTFASDAHEPERLAHGFGVAAAMAESAGFRPGAHAWDFWLA
ncbi:PHP domain-containing protein [Nonomuraea sp. NPDC050328]|uniref:PHP domain-containing protein n=1 Tax=Nonomuraea sp. NPDC050328 TaxID=3364361 RepID=UPI00379BE8F0